MKCYRCVDSGIVVSGRGGGAKRRPCEKCQPQIEVARSFMRGWYYIARVGSVTLGGGSFLTYTEASARAKEVVANELRKVQDASTGEEGQHGTR